MTLISMGKLANLLRLADRAGRFKMLAIDQRPQLRLALSNATGRDPRQVTHKEMTAVKTLITEVLAPDATAVLVDPIYGLPGAVKAIPAGVGLLAAIEESDYENAGPGGGERRSHLLDGWSVAKAKRAGVNAVKLLIHYNPEASAVTLAHQRRLAKRVGEDCQREDIPYLLEVMTYPIDEPAADTPEFARRRPQHTIASAREFSQDEYGADVLKLEFPADLKYAREFCAGRFDGRERPSAYTVAEVKEYCRLLNAAARRPWVILSGGVAIEEFLVSLEVASDTGASGFLCGRAIWQEALPRYPDFEGMRAFLNHEGAQNLQRANAAVERARPWFDHPWFGGWERIRVPEDDETWYRVYATGSRD